MFCGDLLRECLFFQESHRSFPAVNAHYVRMTFDQTNCAQQDQLSSRTTTCGCTSCMCWRPCPPRSAAKPSLSRARAPARSTASQTLPPSTQPNLAHVAHTFGEGRISILRWSDGMWCTSGLAPDPHPADGGDVDYYSIRSASDTPSTTWACSVAGALCNPAAGDVSSQATLHLLAMFWLHFDRLVVVTDDPWRCGRSYQSDPRVPTPGNIVCHPNPSQLTLFLGLIMTYMLPGIGAPSSRSTGRDSLRLKPISQRR